VLLNTEGADVLKRNLYGEVPLEVAIVQGASRRDHECASILRPLTLRKGVTALADKEDAYIVSAMDRLALTSEAMAGGEDADGENQVPIALELICAYLRVAAIHGDMRTIKELGDELVVNVPDHMGRTPLYHACLKGNMGIASALIQRNADIHLAATDGTTPLHMAAEHNHFLVVKLLLKHEAIVDAPDATGRTPLDVAREKSPMATKAMEDHVPAPGTKAAIVTRAPTAQVLLQTQHVPAASAAAALTELPGPCAPEIEQGGAASGAGGTSADAPAVELK
jgi:hypothetical protein